MIGVRCGRGRCLAAALTGHWTLCFLRGSVRAVGRGTRVLLEVASTLYVCMLCLRLGRGLKQLKNIPLYI
jgi:hypothetical protein